jgi:hypothetical protein
LQRRNEDYKKARLRLRRAREEKKEYFNVIYVLHSTPIKAEEMVLLHNIIREEDILRE